MDREEKVKLYRLQKVAQSEAEDKTHKFGQGNCGHLEFYQAILTFQCYDALNEIGMIEREIEMLDFRSKLKGDVEFKAAYDQELTKPVPKPFYYKMMPVRPDFSKFKKLTFSRTCAINMLMKTSKEPLLIQEANLALFNNKNLQVPTM